MKPEQPNANQRSPSPNWHFPPTGGGIEVIQESATTNFREWVTIATNGAVTSSTAEVTTAGYLRLWQITGTNPLTITVVVFAQRSGVTGGQLELARASTSLTSSF